MSTLSRALRDQLDLHGTQLPQLPNGLTNHAPMLAIALARLGAPDEFIIQRTTHEGRNAKRISSKSAQTAPQVLGEHGLDGLAGAGFHGLIRLAYGLDAQHDGEIVSGMAYLQASALTLARNAQANPITFSQWFDAICNAKQQGLAGDYLIADLLQKAAASDAFQAHHIEPESVEMSALAAAALQLYLSRPSIDTLHGVTACHALRVVLGALGDRPSARLALANALVALAMGVGANEQVAMQKSSTLEEIVALLPRVWTRDAHTVKFTYTCLEEYKIYNDPRYLSAASARILK